MLHAVQKTLVLVGLHTGLDTIERERRQGRKDTAGASSNFNSVTFEQSIVALNHGQCVGGILLASSAGVGRRRHDGCFGVAWDILVISKLGLNSHASEQRMREASDPDCC